MQKFPLGGHVYFGPDEIGAGHISRVNTRMYRVFEKSAPKLARAADADRQFTAWLVRNTATYDYTAAILTTLLKRSTNAPPVLEAYDAATDDEVAAVVGFFFESLGRRYADQTESHETSSDTNDADNANANANATATTTTSRSARDSTPRKTKRTPAPISD